MRERSLERRATAALQPHSTRLRPALPSAPRLPLADAPLVKGDVEVDTTAAGAKESNWSLIVSFLTLILSIPALIGA